jgi:hypothetical protein
MHPLFIFITQKTKEAFQRKQGCADNAFIKWQKKARQRRAWK